MTQSSPTKTGRHLPHRGEPPKWAIEKFFDSLGKGPAAIGRVLDRLAKVPILGIVIWFFSSVWLGLVWIGLIGLYVAIGSGVSSIRAYFDLTDLEFFDAWPMQVLLWLMCITLTVVTVRRIRLSLFKLGVWTVHIGILVMVLGCVIYFGNKFEGFTRIFLHKSSDAIYDATERALYAYKMNPDGSLGESVMIPLPHMPIYNDFLRESRPLNRAVPSAELAKLHPAFANIPVVISSYYADAKFASRWLPGPPTKDVRKRGIGFTVRVPGPANTGEPQWLVNTPADRFDDHGKYVFEYLYLPGDKKIAALKSEFKANEGLTVAIPKLNFMKTYALVNDQPIKIEGTPYTVQPLEADERRQLITPGYEGAVSDGLWVTVLREDADGKKIIFDRDVLTRYPELSSDFNLDAAGKRTRVRGALIDPDIELTYHNAYIDHTYIVEDKPGSFFILHRAVGGKVETIPVTMGQNVNLEIGTPERPTKAVITLIGETNNARESTLAISVPPLQQKRKTSVGDWIVHGAIDLRVGGNEGRTYALPFSPFADTTSKVGLKPEPVDIPGVGTFAFVFATKRIPLPGVVTLEKFDFITQRSTSFPQDYVSHISLKGPDGKTEKLSTRLNDPADHWGLKFSQAQWDGDPKAEDEDRHTVLLVGNRPGVYVMISGCGLMLLGVLFAFYVKPILQNMKKTELQNWVSEGRP